MLCCYSSLCIFSKSQTKDNNLNGAFKSLNLTATASRNFSTQSSRLRVDKLDRGTEKCKSFTLPETSVQSESDDTLFLKSKHSRRSKTVYVQDIKLKISLVYPSITKASIELNISKSLISRCLKLRVLLFIKIDIYFL